MKKILSATLIAGLFSGAAFAQTTVSSANIVGYVQTQTPVAGAYKILSLVQFSNGSDTVGIQSAIANMDQLNSAGTGGFSIADKLYVWTGLNYNTYGLFKPASGSPYWMESGSKWERPGRESPATNYLQRGYAVWYATGAGATPTNLIVSGDVYTDATFQVTLPSQFSILSYPYSSSINLTNLVISNATSAGTGGWNLADKIYVFNGSNYDTYGLFKPTNGNPYWMVSGSKWERPGREAPDALEINLGNGFWYESPAGSKTIGFSKIYNID